MTSPNPSFSVEFPCIFGKNNFEIKFDDYDPKKYVFSLPFPSAQKHSQRQLSSYRTFRTTADVTVKTNKEKNDKQ